jgi:tRNA threonylcarbamoyladenosine biosynthesis protein TsaB
MLTLAVDTTAEFGSIALADQKGVRREVLLRAPRGFGDILFAEIDSLLKYEGVGLHDIDLFAGASGPGSFTGVRIGLAAMKGLGEVLGKPVAAVSNLEALARFGTGDLRAALIDARRGELFAALFTREGQRVVPESVLPFPRLLKLLEGREFEWISSHFDPFRAALVGTSFERCPVVIAPRALAAAVAGIAIARGGGDPALIEANYVRRSDAELLWKVPEL